MKIFKRILLLIVLLLIVVAGYYSYAFYSFANNISHKSDDGKGSGSGTLISKLR